MSKPLSVVLVEDEAVVIMQIEMLLEEAGHAVVGTAVTAEDAIPLIRATRPELVLLDLKLRDGSSGVDVAKAVRDREDLMVVFLTANLLKLADDLDGAAAAIAKPFNESAFEGSIAYIEECVHRPPPSLDPPSCMRLAPAFLDRLDRMRTPS